MKLVFRTILLIAIASASVLGFSQTLSWQASTWDWQTLDVTGQSAKPGVGAVVFNNQAWIAYLQNGSCDGNNTCQVVVKQNYGYGLTWSNEQLVYYPGGSVVSNENPSLAVLNGVMYLAYTNYVSGTNHTWITSTNNGMSWTTPVQISIPGGGTYETWYSPVLAVDQNGSSNNLYLALESGGSGNYPVLCQIASDFSTQTCQVSNYNASYKLKYNPSIVVNNGIIYVALVNNNGCLLFSQTSGLTISGTPWQPINCTTYQSNQAPSLAIYNGNLYIAFSRGGNSNYFTVATLANFTSTFGNTTPQIQTYTQGTGTPMMLPITNSLTGITQGVVNLFTWQNKLYYFDGY